ncbi:MAG TPA: HD domain-containing phosphohydrolase [Bryobacteraceae bacterium]|nr:HD domain-containing phosphohydrolase [Bryobacteraceae bacterium]
MPSAASRYAATPLLSRLYLLSYTALGVATLVGAAANWHCSDFGRFISFTIAAALGSVLKLRLPGVRGMVSVSALFVLIAVVNLSLPEALVVASVSMLVQCTWRTANGPQLLPTAFNISAVSVAVLIAGRVLEYAEARFLEPVSLALLAFAYFCANTFPIAIIIGLTERKSPVRVWAGQRWLVPYYVAGASMAWLIGTVPRAIQWELPLICLPLVYLVHRSNRTQVRQMERERAHMHALNGLHLRTIEALALAIDAKDHTTHDHLQRVQLYAIEIGKDLGLTELELEALTAAAVLHDIGKLAVPESIISKPGKLTRAEFEKMKIHPVVGAEILERVEFPYPVVPIVRAHHEKWDGSGYPYGLRGEEIPIGARILSAVDCLDALASDRQYRRALPLDEAMARVASEAGTAFDPKVVRALEKRYQELEARAKSIEAPAQPPLSVDIKITKGSAPAAGFEAEAAAPPPAKHPVAQARSNGRGLESLPEMPSAGVCDLHWDEALTIASLRIQRMISYDAIAFFTCDANFVRARFASGEDRLGLEALNVRWGEGLAGWVAEVGKPILNGNPAVEPGYSGSLGAALAMPLVSAGRVIGVVALYRRERDAFTSAELVALLELCPAVAALLPDGEQIPGDEASRLLELSNAIGRDSETALRA